MKFSQALNFGEQLGWLTPDCIQWPCAPYLRQCAQLRHALRDYLAYGRMLRPVKLSGDVPAITADWQWYGNSPPVTLPAVLTSTWRAVDGRVVVLLANYTTQPATVTCGYDAAELGVAPAAPVTARTAAGAFDVKSWPRVALPAETVVAVELKPR